MYGIQTQEFKNTMDIVSESDSDESITERAFMRPIFNAKNNTTKKKKELPILEPKEVAKELATNENTSEHAKQHNEDEEEVIVMENDIEISRISSNKSMEYENLNLDYSIQDHNHSSQQSDENLEYFNYAVQNLTTFDDNLLSKLVEILEKYKDIMSKDDMLAILYKCSLNIEIFEKYMKNELSGTVDSFRNRIIYLYMD